MKKGPEDCLHCGKCLPHCPSYRFFLEESYSPRGRNLLLSKGFESKSLDFCLFCERCAFSCPQGLSFPEFYIRALKNESLEYPLLSNTLTLLSLTSTGRKLYKDLDLRFLRDFSSGDFYIYLSCGLRHLYPEALYKFLEKIKNFKLKPHLPEKQDCCGILYLSLKSKKPLKKLALRKLEVFSEKKPILLLCATCYWMFKKVYPLLFEGKEEEEAFRELSQRTLLVTEFMKENFEELNFQESPEILYHLPCHLRSFLKKDLTFFQRDLKNKLEVADFCCGSAKITLWVEGFQRDYSRFWKKELFGKKYLATFCTGCYLSFALQLRRPPEIRHWLEFLK